MILKVRSEAVCESAASTLKGHIHNNRSLQYDSLDEEVMLHWNAPPMRTADLFIRSSLNDYFSHTKQKQWLFYKKMSTISSLEACFSGFSCFKSFAQDTSGKIT
ncbi:unnamed protein product [Rotaria socialis]|uniref:Uncharacterized protein n=1 Tax=Rotaria socialis TaxID=392032 RepID=A0A818HI74_9BILA|nr:unnamed protein product [Rotaria socialis]